MLNSVNLIGNLGRDVDIRYTQSGKAVGQFSIAVEGGKDKTEWVNIEAWEKTAENCQKYIKKGSKVYVSGRLKTDSWEKDGQKQYKTVVVANRVIFLDKKENSGSTQQERPSVAELVEEAFETPFTEDDLPF